MINEPIVQNLTYQFFKKNLLPFTVINVVSKSDNLVFGLINFFFFTSRINLFYVVYEIV